MTSRAVTEGPVIQNLGADELACMDCGQRIFNPTSTGKLFAIARERITPQGDRVVADTMAEIDVARCHVCEARVARAESLLNLYPTTRLALGSRSFAVDKVLAVLQAVDMLGISPKTIDRLLGSERLLRVMIDELTLAGRAASWSRRFAPVWAAEADIQTCASRPWVAVDADVRQRLRDSFARVLNAEQDRPTDFPIPDGGAAGCLLCGVGSIRALRSQGLRGGLWSGAYFAQPGTMGGRRTPELVKGFLCSACAVTADEVGALGARALELALMRFVGVEITPLLEAQIVGLLAWCALPRGTKPNSRPWQHVPDLESVADLFRSV
jgi:hypothetical protein